MKSKRNPNIVSDQNSNSSVDLFGSEMMAMIEENLSGEYNDGELMSGKCILKLFITIHN